jgi:murein DD-endopeptidase MepM/ murein hydrolase activator NlpD
MVAAAASVLAACSSDVERLSDYPPIDDNTASVSRAETTSRAAPVERVAARPLQAPQPSPQAYRSPERVSTPTPQWSRDPAPRTASVRARTPAATSGYVIVKPGQTLYSIARANGKTVAELAAANGIAYPYNVKVGQRIRIPGVASPVSPAPTFTPHQQVATAEPAAPARSKTRGRVARAEPVKAPASETNLSGGGRVHRVAPGETLFALGRRYGVNPYRIAAYNGLPRNAQLKVGQVVRIPPAGGWKGSAPGPVVADNKPAVDTRAQKPRHVAGADKAVTTDRISAPTRKDNSRITAERTKNDGARSESAKVAGMFRWPVRGRIISTFGQKPNGTRNEGINIAVPEGTDVRAAADGVVAYAGNELKGYGNLILIRHADGWVTAYAHNKELFVKRGDRVRRGQVIAKAGRTGSVKTPQLHFEIRKKQTAVDPLKYLDTTTAMR